MFTTPVCHVTHVRCEVPKVRCQVSHVRYHMSIQPSNRKSKGAEIFREVSPFPTVTCHILCVTCPLSPVMGHVTHVTCQYNYLNYMYIYSLYLILYFQLPSAALEVQLSVVSSVGRSQDFVKQLPLEYQIVTKTYLPAYLCNSSDICDSNDSSDSSDSSDQKNIFPQNTF